MRTVIARLDPTLGVQVRSVRALRYSAPAVADEDRPPHPRAASGLTWMRGRLLVVQDDAAFLAAVSGDDVAAITLPRGADDRRRFEVGLGNKHHKLDLEACVAVDDQTWLFGSGSTAARDRIAIVGADHVVRITDVAALYDQVRRAVGGPINLEGAACVGDELWLFHRGNTGPDDLGPAVVRFARAAVERWLRGGAADPPPEPAGCTRFDLGAIDGVRLGFTDAVAVGARVYYLAVAEASANAIDDGRVHGTQLGVIDGVLAAALDDAIVRAAPLALAGAPIKAEGLAFAPGSTRTAWIAIDPDDVDAPAQVCEIELIGAWADAAP
jgi:hypothetical protein